jgi:heme/copper-type cytochrome/quinol oxidase subunit 3
MYLLATIFMGLVFAGGVAIEWSTAEFKASEPYGTAFFSMTGLHASHVLSGVALLALTYRLLSKGHYSAESHGVRRGQHRVLHSWTSSVFFTRSSTGQARRCLSVERRSGSSF